MLVEDDRVSGVALTSILRRRGFEVSHVITIAEAMIQLANLPQILILDLMLPDGDGGIVLQTIRTQNLPILVLVTTAVNDPSRLQKIRDLRPDLLLQKPIDLARLLSAMQLRN